jgi:hypothetical protein
MGRRLPVVLASLGAFLLAASASSQSGGAAPPSFSLRWSLKSSALLSQSPVDPLFVPDPRSASGFWRFRVEPAIEISDTTSVQTAFEQQLRVFSSPTQSFGSGVLPSLAAAPYRLRQLDWSFASSGHAAWRGELDRAALHVRLPRANLTIGRQAIGWGRGVLFSAVDLFAPFTPLEADREWRRGVDAARADIKLGDRVSLDAVGAFGESIDQSAFAARVRGYAGRMDLDVMGGRRARDPFAGITSSIALGDIEVHGEAALFSDVPKFVAGGSYRFPLGHGLLTYVEYHYSGYGAASPADILTLLQDPAFQERYLRGDTQILGRHALAAVTSYEWSPALVISGQWLQDPTDGSGVATPSVTFTPSDHWSFIVSGYLPYGGEPSGLTLGSQFGAAPLALFAQIRMYR